MAVKQVVLRGFGNGTVAGSIKGVVLRGYGAYSSSSNSSAGSQLGQFSTRKMIGRFH